MKKTKAIKKKIEKDLHKTKDEKEKKPHKVLKNIPLKLVQFNSRVGFAPDSRTNHMKGTLFWDGEHRHFEYFPQEQELQLFDKTDKRNR